MVILAGALRGVYPAQADPWEAAAYGPAGGGNSRPLFFWSKPDQGTLTTVSHVAAPSIPGPPSQ
jgi:hypothetical protein